MIGMPALWVHNRQWPTLAGALAGLLLAIWGASGIRTRRSDEDDAQPAQQSAPTVAAI